MGTFINVQFDLCIFQLGLAKEIIQQKFLKFYARKLFRDGDKFLPKLKPSYSQK